MAMVEIRGISKAFHAGTPNEVRALQKIDLAVDEGSFVVVIGTNGSGKSALLNAIAGAFFVDTGAISLAGYDVTQWQEHRRAQFIGRVFQNPFSGTSPNMSIAENLALASRRGMARGLGWALQKDLINRFRDRVQQLNMKLEDRMNNAIGSLSGGQRQALTLLMATWRKPKLLLLDEHTAALDPKSAGQIIRLSEEIITREKLTTLMVTHSMHQAASLGDRLVMIHRGRIIHDYSGQEKQRLRDVDLLERFEDVRRKEQLDPTAAAMLKRNYV